MRFLLHLAFSTILFLSIDNLNAQQNNPAEEYFQMAETSRRNMHLDSAIFYYNQAATEFQNLGNTERFIDSYNQIGVVLTRQDKYEEAKTYLNKALSEGHILPDSNSLSIATTYISLGVVFNAEGKYEQSLTCHNKCLSIRLLKLGENDAQVATSYGNLGNMYRNNKEFDKSIEAHLKAMEIRNKLFGETSIEIIESYVGLGNAYREKGEYPMSVEYFEKALRNKIIQRGDGHKDLGRYYKYLSDVYYIMGDKDEGDLYKSKYEAVSGN